MQPRNQDLLADGEGRGAPSFLDRSRTGADGGSNAVLDLYCPFRLLNHAL